MPANVENDPFFEQLTDALRAGPESPQWRDAVAALREQGSAALDDHQLLIAARENLESGKEFRAVRAGPGFTRKLMGEIENETPGASSKGIPTATLVAIFCGVLILAVVAYVGYRMSGSSVSVPEAVDELSAKSQRFFENVASATFAGTLPDGWPVIGSLKLDATNGLRPDPAAVAQNTNQGGGIRWNASLPATQPFAVDVGISSAQPSDAILLEVFISTDPKFSADKGTSSKDLVWQLHGNNQQVLINGSGQALKSAPTFNNGDSVRVMVDQNVAIIETVPKAGGKSQRVWAGAHDLGMLPRSVGVRFLQTGPAAKADVSVTQIKISTLPG